MYNRFVLNETSYHGAGAVKAVAEEITARGFKKAFVCSDPDLIKFGVTKKVTDIFTEENLPVKNAWTNRLVCVILFIDKKISCTYDRKV